MNTMRSMTLPGRVLRGLPRGIQRGNVLRVVGVRFNSTSNGSSVLLLDRSYPTDEWTNLTSTIISALPRKLHLQPDHPVSLTRSLIESHFPAPIYHHYNDLNPVVTVGQNFDSLGFPADHPGRSRTDTYYVNKDTVLRTHTSAHQLDSFRKAASPGFTISADVYRRDAIDRSHYPVFHQMEGARTWSRDDGRISEQIKEEMNTWEDCPLEVIDTEPYSKNNPPQVNHMDEECVLVGRHLKVSLERVFADVFSKGREALIKSGELDPKVKEEPLKVRWVEAYFPFTSPSWELEVFWQGDWLEVLGCGVVQQQILWDSKRRESHVGWAFGLGLERIAMLLFNIPDIRLFWSKDPRFLSQFSQAKGITRFAPFSKYPECYKDVAFWLPSTVSAAGGGLGGQWHENNLMEIVREVGGDLIEDVRCVDEFTHPKTGRKSLCYRINYRSLERTLTNEETNGLHERVRELTRERLGVELR